MNHDEQALRRLLKAASQSPTETPEVMPFALEARILTLWRRGAVGDDSLLLASLFRRAVVCAGVIMLVSIGWSQFSGAREVPGATTLARLEQVIPVVP
jgi:hypothetical protein